MQRLAAVAMLAGALWSVRATMADEGVTVSGRVVNADGSSTRAATVRMSEAGRIREIAARADGTFVFEQVPRGQVLLTPSRSSLFTLFGATQTVRAPAADVVLIIPDQGKVQGLVVDATDDRPLEDYSLHVERVGPDPPDQLNAMRTATIRSPDGQFDVELPLGLVALRVAASGYTPASVPVVAVAASKSVHVKTVRLERNVKIRGRITDATGAPVAGVDVTARRNQAARHTPSTARTDAAGEYTLEDIGIGECELRFRKKGFVEQTELLDIAAGDDARLDVELSSGRIVRGKVVDQLGAPLAGATVRLSDWTFAAIDTGADGAFAFTGVPDRNISVEASKSGYVERRLNVQGSQSMTIALHAGGTIKGTVRGLNAADLAQVRLTGAVGDVRVEGQVDPASGAFHITGLPDGTAKLAAAVRYDFPHGVHEQVELRNGIGGPVVLDFAAGFTITGSVTHRGEPVLDGTVTFYTAGSVYTVGSAARVGRFFPIRNGQYEATRIGRGKCRVVVSIANGIFPFDATPTFVSDTIYDIDLGGTVVRGRLVDALTAEPLGGAVVRLQMTPSGSPSYERMTLPDGTFMMDYVPDGRFRMTAHPPRYAPYERDIIVENGVAAPVELRLTPADAAVIRIQDHATGRPVDASVMLFDSSERYAWHGRPSQAEPGVVRAWLPAGSYTAKIEVQQHAPSPPATVVVPGPEVTVALRQGGTLVIRSRSRAAFNAHLETPAGLFVRMLQDVTRHLAEGDYVVTIRRGESTRQLPVTITENLLTTIDIE